MRLSHGDTPLSIRVPLSRALLESAEILTALQACQLLLTHHLPTVDPFKRAYPVVMRCIVQMAGRRYHNEWRSFRGIGGGESCRCN
jgi:hypothetical protein